MKYSTGLLISVLVIYTVDVNSAEKQAAGKTWAVLMVGYDWYSYTYGAEAAIYRTYQLLIKNGISSDNIIVISPDSVAYDDWNPLPNVVVHGETFLNNYTTDYYLDVVVDYTKEDKLNLTTLYGILSGDSELLKNFGSGKVLKSGPKDNVLFLYCGYGDYGYLTTGYRRQYFYTNEFIPFLEELQEAKKFHNMLLILDGANTGSLFDDYLESNKRILALTNTGRYGNIRLCHWNEELTAYTSGCYSFGLLNYFEYLSAANKLSYESIFDIFYNVRSLTASISKQNIYGQLKQGTTKLKEFIGSSSSKSENNMTALTAPTQFKLVGNDVDPEHYISNLRESIPVSSSVKQEQIAQEIGEVSAVSKAIIKTMSDIVEDVLRGTSYSKQDIHRRTVRLPKNDYACYRNSIESAFQHCFHDENEIFVLRSTRTFAKLCNIGIKESNIKKSMKAVCNKNNQPKLSRL